MPVDLSKTGLTGIESYHSQMESMARTNQMNTTAEAQQFEIEQARKMDALAQKASALLTSTIRREGELDVGDPEAAAERMQSLAEPLETVGNFLMQSGAIEAGADYLSKASEIAKRESDIKNDEVLAQQHRLENIIKTGDIAGRVLGGARNQSEWERGLQVVEESGGIEPEFMEQIKAMPFSPDLAAYFSEQAMSAVERARLEYQALNLDARERDLSMRASNSRRSLELQAQRLAEIKRHNAVVEKNSGTKGNSPGAPSTRNRDSVKNILAGSVFSGIDLEDETQKQALASASEYVAGKAEAIVRENKAINWDTAVQQAIGQAKASGVLKTFTTTETTNYGIFETEPKVVGRKAEVDLEGKSAETAVMPPVTSAGKVDPSKLKRGTYYKLPSGEVGRFDGKGFVVE